MASQRFNKLPKEKRERILEVAGKGFAEHGYDGASLNHILEQAGISKGLAYYYFENKADLFASVVEHYIDKLVAGVDFAELTADFSWAKMRRRIDRGSEDAANTHRIVHLLQHAWELSKEVHDNERVAAQFERIDEWIRALIARGQESGAIRADLPRELLVQMYLGFHEAINRWWPSHQDDLDPEGERELGVKLLEILQGIFQPPGKAQGARRYGSE
jgi:AcrR family transcriptional regulator